MIADAAGHAIAFRIAPGQAHELPYAIPLLGRLPGVPQWVIADRGYTGHRFREHIWDMGHDPRSRRNAKRNPWPAQTGSTTTATASSASGRGSRSGGPSQPAMRGPPHPSQASSASLPLSTALAMTDLEGARSEPAQQHAHRIAAPTCYVRRKAQQCSLRLIKIEAAPDTRSLK